MRQLKALKNKKAAAANAKLAKKVAKQLDETQMKEVVYNYFLFIKFQSFWNSWWSCKNRQMCTAKTCVPSAAD
jgi:hypothetical protein